MELSKMIQFLFIYFTLWFHISFAATVGDKREMYIVYMGEVSESVNRATLMDAHHSLLSEAIGNDKLARINKIHSYGRSFNGFAARLLPHEAKFLSQKKGVISVFPNKVQKLLTTRSWDFIGMPETVHRNVQAESEIIVALLDTGVWPESPSFSDKGFGPPPKKWKGTCAKGANFTGCNNKVIGAQYFNLGGGSSSMDESESSPVDLEGHGTHTASTAAGVAVKDANVYGIARGTARGGVPSARIASYKVCWGLGCLDVDLLVAFDAAIADGVDVISVSIGGIPRTFTQDPIGIGSFHAFKKGILTVCAGGNDGPTIGSINNVAPWIITVAASTTDRMLAANVKLGNGDIIPGTAINTFVSRPYALTNGEHAKNTTSIYGDASACDYGTLSKNEVKGRIVHCQGPGGEYVIRKLGGTGTIMSIDESSDIAFATVAAGTYVTSADGERIDKYINSTSSATAIIDKTRSIHITAPATATFSSRGPQQLCPNILKPDIAAPGVNILAAYTIFTSLSSQEGDKRVVKYNVESGTSMACPHAAGAASYIKSFHPTWSPSVIKSALMTTAQPMKIKTDPEELASGSGNMNPTAALHPGLVYDIDLLSYIGYLCKLGYKDDDIALLAGSKGYNCSSAPQAKGADGLNYPSIHLQVNSTQSVFSATFYRTVTNVGFGKSVYTAKMTSSKGLSIQVKPMTLSFDKPYQKKSFEVTVKGKSLSTKQPWYLSGSLTWFDSKHFVKSPILVIPL